MFKLGDQAKITIEENNLDLLEIKGLEKKQITNKIKEVFVIDNPRALWLNFKYKPSSIKYEGDYPHKKLPDIISNGEPLLFLIDDNDEYYLFKGYLTAIMQFIEECAGLNEYYLVNLSFTKMACETDHGELLYINITENSLKG